MAANAMPWDCSIELWLYGKSAASPRCQEAADLREGGFADPPRPAAPPVPPGGYSGAVTDPRAVDWVVDESARVMRSANEKFFDEQGTFARPPSSPDWAMALAAGVGLFALYRVVRS